MDSITLGIPLLIRLLEFAREEAADDEELHEIVEQMVYLSGEIAGEHPGVDWETTAPVLVMQDYEDIVGQHLLAEGAPNPGFEEVAGPPPMTEDELNDLTW